MKQFKLSFVLSAPLNPTLLRLADKQLIELDSTLSAGWFMLLIDEEEDDDEKFLSKTLKIKPAKLSFAFTCSSFSKINSSSSLLNAFSRICLNKASYSALIELETLLLLLA